MLDYNRLAPAVAATSTFVTVREVFPIDDRMVRVVATACSSASGDACFAGLRDQFPKMAPVRGSFVSLSCDKRSRTFEGIMGIIDERVVLSDENREQFKAVAGNMYMDKNEVLWSLKATASGDILVKSVVEDDMEIMQKLVACASSDRNDFAFPQLVEKSAEKREQVQGGDVVLYVSALSGNSQMGIACAELDNADGTSAHQILVVRPNGQSEVVSKELVVAASEQEFDDDGKCLATASAQIDWNAISAYYAKMFARRPSYYEAFMSRFRAHTFF